MGSYRVAVIVGSNHSASINRKLAQALVRLGGETLEFEWIRIDDLPLYCLDLEGSRPPEVTRFTDQMKAVDAVLVVTPEHNRSLPAVLKNAIDWGSKPAPDNVWRGKPAAITGASPGAIGTALVQQHLRQILGILGAQVMGGEVYISFKPDLIAEDDTVTNESTRVFLETFMGQFATFVRKLAAP
ncbi:ACP phosphodiesterase [Rhodospirillum rubrum]|uniref:NADPH-dependent FMN reductase n=1 Tax=Rhodospirillum rubrum TaxID=1085 RepID=UPI00190512D9|nr:NADPH-dependent FMN reductase [Rhodospirillum rubrum]MBK1665695.1 ACP phosphodiesterase [Rhodospirillum rubrum]MBK1677829.1 ACP phosphodiesterase [Rhodospirillum rubrum]